MKKHIALLVIAIIVLLPININALENNYENPNKVSIPLDTYTDLQKLFTTAYIDTLTQDEYDDLMDKNIDFDSVVQNKIYVRTDYNTLTGQVINTEVSELEYNLGMPAGQYMPQASYIETSYKWLNVSVANAGTGYAFFSSTAHWKTMPATRSFDVIAARLSGFTKINGTQMGKQIYTLNGTTDSVQYSWNGTNINNQSNGFGISMNLLDSNVTFLECTINSSLTKDDYSARVSTSYQHAVTNVTLATSKSYILEAGGLGNVIQFTGIIPSYYDGMNGVYTYLVG